MKDQNSLNFLVSVIHALIITEGSQCRSGLVTFVKGWSFYMKRDLLNQTYCVPLSN